MQNAELIHHVGIANISHLEKIYHIGKADISRTKYISLRSLCFAIAAACNDFCDFLCNRSLTGTVVLEL